MFDVYQSAKVIYVFGDKLDESEIAHLFKDGSHIVLNTSDELLQYLETLDRQLYAAYVDGSYTDDSKKCGYGVVLLLPDGSIETTSGSSSDSEYTCMRNVGGEILAAMSAVQEAKAHGTNELVIYYDYEGIEKWVTGQWKANLEMTRQYRDFMNNCDITLYFNKVKAHSNDLYNDRADQLAKSAIGLK